MVTLNGTNYRLCLLDTNAISELIGAEGPALGNFLSWTLAEPPKYIPSFTAFTVLELRRRPELYARFLERFGPVVSTLLKSHEQLLEEEAACYPDPSGIDPMLLGFSGSLGSDGNQLAKVFPYAFSKEDILERERYWNEGEREIVEGIVSLVPNYQPERGDRYADSEIETFFMIAGLTQLFLRVREFTERMEAHEQEIDINAFPSLKASLYTVFHKFYSERTRKPTRSDGFDIINAAAIPYVDAVVTEKHQAEVLRKTMRRDDFLGDLRVFTLRDLRRGLS